MKPKTVLALGCALLGGACASNPTHATSVRTPASEVTWSKERSIVEQMAEKCKIPEDANIRALDQVRDGVSTRNFQEARTYYAQGYVYGQYLMMKYDADVAKIRPPTAREKKDPRVLAEAYARNNEAMVAIQGGENYRSIRVLHDVMNRARHTMFEYLALNLAGAYRQKQIDDPKADYKGVVQDYLKFVRETELGRAKGGDNPVLKHAYAEIADDIEDFGRQLYTCQELSPEKVKSIYDHRLATREKLDPRVAKYTLADWESMMKRWNASRKNVRQVVEEILAADGAPEIGPVARGDMGGSARVPASGAGAVTWTGSTFPAKRWALTFDDGPALTSPIIRQNLANAGMKATFFVLAKQIGPSMFPSQARKHVEEGHWVSSHSYTHAQVNKLRMGDPSHPTPGTKAWEVVEARRVLNEVLDQMPEGQRQAHSRNFRLPYGAGFAPKDQPTLDLLGAQGLANIYWNVDTLDWQDKNAASVANRAIAAINRLGHGIILMHDIQQVTTVASATVMAHLKRIGAEVVTIPQAIGER